MICVAIDRSGERLRTHLAFSSAAADGQTMVLALAAGTKSDDGGYKARPLSASSTWPTGGSSSTFP